MAFVRADEFQFSFDSLGGRFSNSPTSQIPTRYVPFKSDTQTLTDDFTARRLSPHSYIKLITGISD
jgi:hypothetical protein